MENAGIAAFILIGAGVAHSVEIQTTVSDGSVRIGETLTVTLTVHREGGPTAPEFAGAALSTDSHWRPGGQAVGSERPDSTGFQKTWRFDLTPVAPGTTLVFPIVHLTSSSGSRDSSIGAPVSVAILPAPGPSRWPWLVALTVAAGAVILLIRWLIRRRRFSEARQPLPSPLVEALQMLEAIGDDRRVDRGLKYFADVEGVIYGYLSRRLGRALPGMTPSEVLDAVAAHAGDREALTILGTVLRQLEAARFGGERPTIEDLNTVDRSIREVLERLDATWVRDTLPDQAQGGSAQHVDPKPR